MKNLIILLIVTLTQVGIATAQKTVGGVPMPKKQMIGKTILTLNGAGVREKFFMDMYACGLYLKKSTHDASEVIEGDTHAALKIHIVSGLITSKKMTDAVEDGFKNATGGKTKAIRKEIDAFKAVFSNQEIQKGDVYDIIYVPGRGTLIFKNGKIQPIIKGLAFKKALFGIWLCNKPADKNLKKELLGN
ncbi:MAG: chalcone isomerase family protein [Flavobacteriales bacterium]|nr:chalcone isomerase family protein [Flavobacteriales bacterium]